jgi:hypothetical protein
MTLSDIAKSRLISQQLYGTKLKSPVEMVQWFGAIQAQEYAQALWSLGLRLPDMSLKNIEKDFNEGKIIRTHLLRPTWHFVTAADIRWLLEFTAPHVNKINAYMYRKHDLNEKELKTCVDILIKTLNGGRQLNRDMINTELQKKKIIAKGDRLSYILMYAELHGIICSGARDGNSFTYTLLDEKVPITRHLSRDESLAELTTRYFTSRGPATIKDFSTWSGLTLADCKKGILMKNSCFEREVIEGCEYYFSPGICQNIKTSKDIYFLPVYDEFIMGYKDRSAILIIKNRVNNKTPLLYDCTIVLDGQVIGTWRRRIKNKSIDLQVEFFKPLNKNQIQAFNKTVERFGEFTDMNIKYIS